MRDRNRNGNRLRRAGVAAIIAMAVGMVVIVVAQGFSSEGLLRAAEDVALGVIVVAALLGSIAFLAVRMGGWRDPVSEQEFDRIVRRAERLADDGLVVDPEEADFMVLDPLDDGDFDELIREALDDLPDLLRNALRNITVVVSDGGRRAGSYGRYESHRSGHDRIVIFRDSLRRDFGDDGDDLREQVTRTVRHELAQHLSLDELGVSQHDL